MDGFTVSRGSAAAEVYAGATSTTSCPIAARSRRNVSIDVETPLTRGKKTSEIFKMRMQYGLCHPCKRVSSHVFRLRRCGDHVVFDSNAAEGLELLHHRPVDMVAARIGV